jgi:hypothetical protein
MNMAFVKCIDSQKMEVKSKWLEAVYDSIEEQVEFILAHCLHVRLEVRVVRDPNTYNTLWEKIRYYWTWRLLALKNCNSDFWNCSPYGDLSLYMLLVIAL